MTTSARRHRLDINSADPADLASVPGLDAALAQRIVAQRPFHKLKELLLVEGLEPEIYEQVSPYLKAVLARDVVAPAAAAPARRLPRRKPLAPAPAGLTMAGSPPEPALQPEAARPEPEVIVLEAATAEPAVMRQLVSTAPPPRALMLSPVAVASAALFESYAGPRIVFALFSLTLILLAVGVSSGRLTLGPRAAPAPPQPSPAEASTQISAAVAATITALPAPTASPLPTLTASPASSPSPAATPAFVSNSGLAGAGAQIFNETFTPGGYWNVGENDFSNIFLAKGKLTIRMKVPGAIAWAVNGYAGADFYYQGTARVGACQAGDYYGLVFRFKSDSDLYLFGLACDGRYRVVRRENGAFKNLVDFTFTPEVIVGSNTTNLLAVRAQGSELNLFVNDHLLTTIANAGGGSGLFGVFAKAAATKDLQVDFSDLSAWQLNP